MSTSAKVLPAVGFLTVLERPDTGFTGGYLLLNLAGRPVEFHCTSPIRPNRSQEILYGPTLRPFVIGEQIGHALVTKSAIEPLFVCTDLPDVLSLRDLVSYPVLMVREACEGAGGSRSADELGNRGDDPPRRRLDSAHGIDSPHVAKRFGNRDLLIPRGQEDQWERVRTSLAPIADNLDLLEPFNRIRDAIDEIQKTAK